MINQLQTFDVTCWRYLGEKLKVVPKRKLNEIAAEIAGRPHGQRHALSDVIDFWLKNDLSATWEKLAKAVEDCEDKTTAQKIRKHAGILAPPGNVQLRCNTNSILMMSVYSVHGVYCSMLFHYCVQKLILLFPLPPRKVLSRQVSTSSITLSL